MKRQEILEKLGEIENAKEICDFIMDLNGKDIQNYKAQIDELKNTHAEELKSKDNIIAEKDKEIAGFNNTEYEELKTYKAENEAKIKSGKETEAIKEFLKANKYSSDDILITYIADKIKPEFDENFKIVNSDNILTALKENAKQYQITETTAGATATTPVENTKGEAQPQTLRDAFAQKFNIK